MSQISAIHSRMARAALGWTVRKLAEAAKLSHDTVVRLEKGEELKETTNDAIRAALETAGVEFTNGESPGVRLRKGKSAPLPPTTTAPKTAPAITARPAKADSDDALPKSKAEQIVALRKRKR